MPGKHIPSGRRQRVYFMAKDGMKRAEIAKRLRISTSSVDTILIECGWSKRVNKRDQVIALIKEGLSKGEILEQFHGACAKYISDTYTAYEHEVSTEADLELWRRAMFGRRGI